MAEDGTKISEIKGIGPKLAERIKETLDIESVEQLIELEKDKLKEVKGIGSSKAEKIWSSIEELTKECHRCGQTYVGEDRCPKCTAELEEKLEPLKKEIEYFKNDNFQGESWKIENTLEKIDSKLSEGRFEEAEELINSVEEELNEAQDFSDKLSDIEKEIEEKKVINLPTYREELELARKYMRYAEYEEANNRAERILDYLEKEEKYEDVEESELLNEDIEEFSRYLMGVGARAGENIYGSGFHTLEDIYKAGSKKLQEEADIEEDTAKKLINVLDSLFEELEIEKEYEVTETEEEKKTKEEEIFKKTKEEEVAQEEKEEESPPVDQKEEKKKKTSKKPKKVKKKKVVKKKKPKKEELTSIEELFSIEEEQQIQKNDEKELKYWIPAIIIPILLAIAAYVLFFM